MMCDSPEVIKVEMMMEVIKEEVNNISDVEDGPDQENNIKEKIVQNNNDCSVEDLEMMSRMDKELIIEEEIRRQNLKMVRIVEDREPQEKIVHGIQNFEVTRETKYQPGDSILKTKPFAFVINASHRSIVCEYCWGSMVGGGLTWCHECGLVRYCGEVCRMKGWDEHKMECSFIGQEGAGGRVLNDELRLVARLWLNIRMLLRDKMKEESGEYSMSWDQLEEHREEILAEKQELIDSQFNLLGAVMKKEDMPDKDTFISIYCKMLINCINLRSDRSFSPEPFGVAVYLLGSMFDHSCQPNCSFWFSGREISVKAIRNIPVGNLTKNAFISYINIMDDTKTRNESLQKNWFFTCKCPLCTEKDIERNKRCMRCSRCGEDRALDTEEWDLPPPCKHCKRSSVVEDQMQLEKYKKHYHLLTQKGGIKMSDMSYDYLSAWCAKEMDQVFGKGDILYIQTVHYVHTICMTNRLWPAAAVYGGIAVPAFRKYYGEYSREYAGLLVSLGEAYGKEGILGKCGSCFKTAERIYRVVPGEHHPFYTDVFMPLFNKYVTIASAVLEFSKYQHFLE